jgi:cytoplasmic iron level regulating protein YaaA (DUF328/UPF0246 family)
MLMVISPAKSLNFDPPERPLPLTTPQLKDDIAELAQVAKKLRPRDLKRLMGISDNLAQLNHERFQHFDPEMEDGLQARTLDRKSFDWAQEHLRILSGLYGVLRPADALQPYRLEMGVGLKTRRGKTLYAFWKKPVAQTLNEAAKGMKDPTLVNLASQEYFGAVDVAALQMPVVTCHFKEEKDDELRVLGFYAKKARGLMARFAIDHRIEQAEKLKGFNVEGYAFQPKLSTDTDWIFSRPQPPLKGS